MQSKQIVRNIFYCFTKLSMKSVLCTFCARLFCNLPSNAGNNIAQDCQLLFGLVAKEMRFKLLTHICNISCYRLLFDPYSL